VKAHLLGTLADGTVFEDSRTRGTPFVLPVGPEIIPCWREAITRLKTGGKSRVVCPPEAAFGEFGRPPLVAPGATVAYEVELLEVAPQVP
jgi:FKBP-type peptidyl-prolyl cis-trans isomerase